MTETFLARRVRILRAEVAAEKARREAQKARNKARTSCASPATLRRLYHGPEQLSIGMIARRLGVVPSTVYKAMRRYGIPRRDRVTSMRVARKHNRRPRGAGEVFGVDYRKEGEAEEV